MSLGPPPAINRAMAPVRPRSPELMQRKTVPPVPRPRPRVVANTKGTLSRELDTQRGTIEDVFYHAEPRQVTPQQQPTARQLNSTSNSTSLRSSTGHPHRGNTGAFAAATLKLRSVSLEPTVDESNYGRKNTFLNEQRAISNPWPRGMLWGDLPPDSQRGMFSHVNTLRNEVKKLNFPKPVGGNEALDGVRSLAGFV